MGVRAEAEVEVAHRGDGLVPDRVPVGGDHLHQQHAASYSSHSGIAMLLGKSPPTDTMMPWRPKTRCSFRAQDGGAGHPALPVREAAAQKAPDACG